MTRKGFQCCLALSVLLAGGTAPAGRAQITSQAQISGLVTDYTGASIPDARVKVTNGYTNNFRGEVQLNVGRYGKLEILE